MKVTLIEGVSEILRTKHHDSRGWFERIYDFDLAQPCTSDGPVSQISLSQNSKKFTLRGLHGMDSNNIETKIVECLIGGVFDVVVDLRPNSSTYLDHMTFMLEDSSPRAILIPPGCLHGYLTLTDQSLICYQMSTPYNSESEVGLRWDDPTFGIDWPASPHHISQKDLSWALFDRFAPRF